MLLLISGLEETCLSQRGVYDPWKELKECSYCMGGLLYVFVCERVYL